MSGRRRAREAGVWGAFALGVLLLAAGCAIGPRYRPVQVVPASAELRPAPQPDSMRVFFDSLATARAADLGPSAGVATLRAQSPADIAWLDVLHDSVLIGLVKRALENNRDLAAARARLTESRAEAGAARSLLWPDLSLNASDSRNKTTFGSQSIPVYSAWRATADVAWELDVWGVARKGLEATNADVSGEEDLERATELALVSEVATGYLGLLELDQERSIAEETLASRRSTYELARDRLTRGVISELDVRQFEAQLAVPAARLAQVERAQAQAEHALDVLLGQGPAPIPRGANLAEAARAVSVPDSVSVSLVERRPDVAAAERAYAAATARAGVASALRLPAFHVGASWGTQATTPGTMFTPDMKVYQVIGAVSIPIFTGGRLTSEARAARAQAEEARARYEQTTLTALGETGDALASVRTSREQLAALETQAAALRRALELAQARYQGGVANYLEVLDAERSLFDAQLARSQAQFQELASAVQLYKALGGSWGEGK